MLNDDDDESSQDAELDEDLVQIMYKRNVNRSKRNMQSLKFLSFKAIALSAKGNPLNNPDTPPLPLNVLCMEKSRIHECQSTTSLFLQVPL